jgi:hypothetical protein
MMDDTERSEREPAGRAEALILRPCRHRAAPVKFHFLELVGVALASVCFEAHRGLYSDITLSPKSAKSQPRSSFGCISSF